MFTIAAVTPAEVVVDSSLLCVTVAACAVVVVDVIVAVPSTLSTLVAFASQEKSGFCGDNTVGVDDDDDDEEDDNDDGMPIAVKLMDVDGEISSDEEDDDDNKIIWSGTFSGTTAVPRRNKAVTFGNNVPVHEHSETESGAKAESAAATESAVQEESKPRKPWFRRLSSKTKSCFRIATVRKQARKRRQQVKEESTKPADATVVAPCAPVSEPRTRKRVAFGVVQVQEYGLVLGDNPSCKDYPLSLDWAHTEPKEYSLDELERAKARSPPRRGMGPNDRMLRIAAVAGIPLAELQKQERTRRRKADKETYAAAVLSNASADEADDADADAEVSVSSKSLGAYQV